MLYEIEYWCVLCNKWLALQLPPTDSLEAALNFSRSHQTAQRPMRVVDDFGQVYW